MALVVRPQVIQTRRYPQPRAGESIGPAPSRNILASPSGAGKSQAALTHLNAYFSICSRIHIFSSTLSIDPTYDDVRKRIRKMLTDRGVDVEDPEEKFEHESLANLGLVVNGMVKRTKNAIDSGAKEMPLTYLLIDDGLGGTSGGGGGYRNNVELDRLFSRGRHAGAVICLLSQTRKVLSTTIRKNASHVGFWRLPKMEFDSIRAELAGRGGMEGDTFLKAYQLATTPRFGFLWIRLVTGDLYSSFSKKLVLK